MTEDCASFTHARAHRGMEAMDGPGRIELDRSPPGERMAGCTGRAGGTQVSGREGSGVREYLLICLTAAVVTYLLTPAVQRFAIRFGAMTEVRDRDVHAIPTPRMGGLAMFGGMVAALVVAARLPEMRKVLANGDVSVGRGLLLSGALV